MTRFINFILLAIALSVGVRAQTSPDDAREFVVGLTNEVFDLVDDPGITEDQRRTRLASLIQQHVGIEFLARLMLASETRANATAEQVEAYDALSRQYVVDLFIQRVGQLGENRLMVEGTNLARRGDVTVRTQLRKKDGGLVDVDWRVRSIDGTMRVINLSANGVSIVIVKRDEFSSIARNEGFDALLEVMRASLTGQQVTDPS